MSIDTQSRRPSTMSAARNHSFTSASVGHSEANTPPKRQMKSSKRSSFDYSNGGNSRMSIPIGYSGDINDEDSVADEASMSTRDIGTMRPSVMARFESISESYNEINSIMNGEKMNRALGATQSVGTSVSVLCRMRPLSTPFTAGPSASSNSNYNTPFLNATSVRNSLITYKEVVDDDDSDDDDDDNGTWKRKGEDSLNYTIYGNHIDYLDENGHAKGTFEFSKIFNEKSSQKKIFSSPEIQNIIDSLFLGFNGTIFTYGQTNAGKTYTMEGDNLRSLKSRGIMPRTLSRIYGAINETIKAQIAAQKADENPNGQNSMIEFTVTASYYEIYCEKIRDILNPTNDNMKLRETKNDGFVVKDLTEIVCQNEEEVLRLLERGKNNRATAATLMNAVSSRSHSIFCVTIKQKITMQMNEKPDMFSFDENMRNEYLDNAPTNAIIRKSRLFLVDLAGSEKVSQTGAEGTLQ